MIIMLGRDLGNITVNGDRITAEAGTSLARLLIRQGDILFRDWNLRQEYREHLGAHVI